MEKICFVCLGNICRSPMAEFIMKDLVAKAKCTDKFEISSRATSSWEHGNSIHIGTQKVLKKHNIFFDQKKSSQMISNNDLEYFDEIIAMDDKNIADLNKLVPAGLAQKLRKLLEEDVPDPWYTGDFDEVYRLINIGCQRLLENLLN